MQSGPAATKASRSQIRGQIYEEAESNASKLAIAEAIYGRKLQSLLYDAVGREFYIGVNCNGPDRVGHNVS